MRLNEIISLSILFGCSSGLVPTFNYPEEFDTSDQPIEVQEKRVYNIDNIIYADNNFDGARLNDFYRLNDSVLVVETRPENEPINPSPWYAFRIWSPVDTSIYISFNSGKYKHRYYPKWSEDGENWSLADSSNVLYDSTKIKYLKINLSSQDTIWVAGQEVISSRNVWDWCESLSKSHDDVLVNTIGTSRLGRPLKVLKIDADTTSKPTLIILSRQHPPEVTGYKAMQFFVDEILSENHEATGFRKEFSVLIFPLLNPDGVDLGHWRHSAAGIDLNRDWARYNQPEIANVVEYIYSELGQNNVVMGIDFHSTYHDVFYTNDTLSRNRMVRDLWFEEMSKQISGYSVNEKSSPIKRPVSKSWFFSAFGVEGITYEVGDDTPEEFLELKGRVSARAVMKALLTNQGNNVSID